MIHIQIYGIKLFDHDSANHFRYVGLERTQHVVLVLGRSPEINEIKTYRHELQF